MSGLLEPAVGAHGGVERWTELSEIRLRLDCGGLALATKWQARALRGLHAVVSTREPRTVLEPFPRAGLRGVFEPDVVRIQSADGALRDERRAPRRAFPGFRHAVRWDHLDVLYFAGYALWNYVTVPFILLRPGVEAWEVSPGTGGLRRLEVRFPPGFPTHSRRQVFSFDERGLLRRLDYTAEVFGRWARAATIATGTGSSTGSRWRRGGASSLEPAAEPFRVRRSSGYASTRSGPTDAQWMRVSFRSARRFARARFHNHQPIQTVSAAAMA